MKIPVYKPMIDHKEREYVLDALNRGELSGASGSYVRRFEEEFSRYSECSHGIAVNSGTTALQLAVATLGIGDGDEILIPSFTSMASFFAALYERAKPVPVDIEADTWNIDPKLIEEKINKRTKAIMVVHIYGHPVDMDPVMRIARKHGLSIIEDCAEAHGALYKGRKVGSLGDMGCFSFFGNKIITTGEGGMVTTNDDELAEKARLLSNLAFGKTRKFMHVEVGFKYPMSNIQAAVGCAQMEKIDAIIEKKRALAKYYNSHLSGIPGLQLPVEKGYAKNVYWMYHMVVHKKDFGADRDEVMARLEKDGVETREGFVPYTGQELFIAKRMVTGRECPVSNYTGRNGFYVPSGPLLTQEELGYVCAKITEIRREAATAMSN